MPPFFSYFLVSFSVRKILVSAIILIRCIARFLFLLNFCWRRCVHSSATRDIVSLVNFLLCHRNVIFRIVVPCSVRITGRFFPFLSYFCFCINSSCSFFRWSCLPLAFLFSFVGFLNSFWSHSSPLLQIGLKVIWVTSLLAVYSPSLGWHDIRSHPTLAVAPPLPRPWLPDLWWFVHYSPYVWDFPRC